MEKVIWNSLIMPGIVMGFIFAFTFAAAIFVFGFFMIAVGIAFHVLFNTLLLLTANKCLKAKSRLILLFITNITGT